MVDTTTIRVDRDTHARLVEISAASGASMVDTVREAVEALRRQRFARTVAGQVETLRSDPTAWSDYLAEAESTSVRDGLPR